MLLQFTGVFLNPTLVVATDALVDVDGSAAALKMTTTEPSPDVKALAWNRTSVLAFL